MPAADAQALATAIDSLIDDPALAARLGKQARKRVTKIIPRPRLSGAWNQYMSNYMPDNKEQMSEDIFKRLSAGVSGLDDGLDDSSGDGPDRRANRRAVDRFPVALETADGRHLVAHMIDLSQGGMKVDCKVSDTAAEIREGDTVKVVLNSPFLAAKNVRVIQDCQVLACQQLPDETMRIRLHSVANREGYATSVSGLQPDEFVMPVALEDTFMQTQAQVNMQLPQSGAKLLLFSGTELGAGSSTISWWFSVCLARTNERRVLFVDGNVHTRMRETGSGSMAGFVDLLLGRETLEGTILPLGTGAPDLLNAGRVGDFTSGDITQSDVDATFTLLREHYDYIIIDAPPVLASSLTALWAQSAGWLYGGTGIRQNSARPGAGNRIPSTTVRDTSLGAMLNKV
ncbi:MAG: PilZ domain-containing protein [Halioglobus sp.]|nr:PilZ domain-containing protein [Halioglobus sp.]